MSIPTTRAEEPANIKIDSSKCTVCGLCVSVCKDFSLTIKNKKVEISQTPLFGCIGCGHCMSICPTDAIEIYGREITPKNIFELPTKEASSSYNQLLSLFQRRRSIRDFLDQDIEQELVDKILIAAQTAPTGLPPTDVSVLLLNGKERTHAFAKDFCEYLKSMKWLTANWFLNLMRPFWGKNNDNIFRNFAKPAIKAYIQNMNNGINLITYDAPLAMYFYTSPLADPADPIVAATYAMIAGESLGLGTCMLGSVHPFIQNGPMAKKFRNNHGIKYASREGIFVIFGYPQFKYKKGIARTFANIDTV